MGIWLIGSDVLARSRFRISALAETVATMLVLNGRPNRPGQLADPAGMRARFRARVAADPVAEPFLKGAFLPAWIADFLCMPPGEGVGWAEELHRIRTLEAAHLRADLAGDDPALDAPDLPNRVADLLDWVWTETVAPDWERRTRAFEADIVARTRRLSIDGWAGALNDMRPGLKWLGEGRLQINVHDYPPHDLAGGELLFIPSTTSHGWVGWDFGDRYSVIYPCTGLLAGPQVAPHALRRLLGPARATVLGLLDNPMSTTQLVSVTGFALGSVGHHLKVLLDARLVGRRRAGRSVLYYRTPDGDRLVSNTR